jgi:hypothetical protein
MTCMCACIYVCICMSVYVHIHMYTYIYIYIYILLVSFFTTCFARFLYLYSYMIYSSGAGSLSKKVIHTYIHVCVYVCHICCNWYMLQLTCGMHEHEQPSKSTNMNSHPKARAWTAIQKHEHEQPSKGTGTGKLAPEINSMALGVNMACEHAQIHTRLKIRAHTVAWLSSRRPMPTRPPDLGGDTDRGRYGGGVWTVKLLKLKFELERNELLMLTGDAGSFSTYTICLWVCLVLHVCVDSRVSMYVCRHEEACTFNICIHVHSLWGWFRHPSMAPWQ